MLIEDSLFFGDLHYPAKFHQQKLWLHRASMKRYEAWLQSKDWRTEYLEYDPQPDSLSRQLEYVADSMTSTPARWVVADPVDFMLEKRLRRISNELEIDCEFVATPGFINDSSVNQKYRASKSRWFMADFYKHQRRRLQILIDGDEPAGGKWSFDEENRKKIPKKKLDEIPDLLQLKRDEVDQEAIEYVKANFADNPGNLDELYYPSKRTDAKKWLNHFLKNKFKEFGDYEDAIAEGESWLWHSILTPSLNTGLLTPAEVVKETLKFAQKNDVPLNSQEGFIRQVIGWREFIRATYEDLGVQMRTNNYWNHQRDLPDCFYDGSTGIPPVDDTIQRIRQTGYCHHIERLMVLGGFMFLCEIKPTEIYRWFMEMFVDSYDWVMVPNVYAMSQHAAGGLITTKPYFSGSSYIRKMSHFKKGQWCDIWDGLYWRWIWNHVDELAKNPRWAMMCSMAQKMDEDKREAHLQHAESFLEKLDS